jgi:type VI secretion system secreted protein VgrG
MPAEVQFVTADGSMRSVCGLVQSAAEGQCDGGFATYELRVRDALALMELRINTRVFLNMSEVEIVERLLKEWRQINPVLARTFDFDLSAVNFGKHPGRAFTMQLNESDSQFIKRLLKRRGIAWFVRPGKPCNPGSDLPPTHELVLFDDAWKLPKPVPTPWRYHRSTGTEQADSITAWSATRTIAPGGITRHSWDYKSARMETCTDRTLLDQGVLGNQCAASLTDSLVDAPHMGDNSDDFRYLTRLRIQHHEYKSKQFYAESDHRTACVGASFSMRGHPEIDTHPLNEREFTITELHVVAENNLPKALSDKAQRLFALNGWDTTDGCVPTGPQLPSGEYYSNRFTCVRRGIPIVPSYDPRSDLPPAPPMYGIVVADEGEEITCNEFGCVKVRFLECTVEDHAHAQGAGASGTSRDSAWIRSLVPMAGDGYGMIALCRAGDEVLIQFINGNCDRPVAVHSAFNGRATPPAFSHSGNLPGNKALSGIKSKELKGRRYNQMRLDDTPGQISAQLASEHGHSELNLGYLTHPRSDGNGNPRGEGAELRSDEHIAVRAAKGLLLTAWKRLNAIDSQLAREEYLSLMEQCLEQFRTLGDFAAQHQALPIDDKPQVALQSAIREWDNASNTAAKTEGGGAPAIGITAPDGISYATPQTILSYAGRNIDSVAQQHMQFTCGQRFNLNAGKGISLFARSDGIKAIAHCGKLVFQSQHDDTEINAGKNVTITASNGIIKLMAKEIHAVAEDGSFIKIGGGITLGTNGDITHKAANFSSTGPATMHTELPHFAGEGSAAPNWIALNYMDPTTGRGIAEAEYEIHFDGAPGISGKLDAAGKALHKNVMNKPVKKVIYKPRQAQEAQAGLLNDLLDS